MSHPCREHIWNNRATSRGGARQEDLNRATSQHSASIQRYTTAALPRTAHPYDRTAFISAISLLTFFLSIVQFKNDWKTKAQVHQRSFAEYAAVKADCRTFTSGVRTATTSEHQRIRDRYDMVTEVGTHIPDKEFLSGKAHHLRKVFLSKYLDTHPGAWLPDVCLKLFLRDNLHINLLVGNAQITQDADESR